MCRYEKCRQAWTCDQFNTSTLPTSIKADLGSMWHDILAPFSNWVGWWSERADRGGILPKPGEAPNLQSARILVMHAHPHLTDELIRSRRSTYPAVRCVQRSSAPLGSSSDPAYKGFRTRSMPRCYSRTQAACPAASRAHHLGPVSTNPCTGPAPSLSIGTHCVGCI